MTDFIPGQRVISDTEPELGLGTITAVEHRTLEVEFPASDENRTYTRQSPPLHRVRFNAGDTLQDRSGLTIHIEKDQERDVLQLYFCVTEEGTYSL